MPTITLPHTPRTLEIPPECQRDAQDILAEYGGILEHAPEGSCFDSIHKEVKLLAGVQ